MAAEYVLKEGNARGDPVRAGDPHVRDRLPVHARSRRRAGAQGAHRAAGDRRPEPRRRPPRARRAAVARRGRGRRRRDHRRGPSRARGGDLRRAAVAAHRRRSPATWSACVPRRRSTADDRGRRELPDSRRRSADEPRRGPPAPRGGPRPADRAARAARSRRRSCSPSCRSPTSRPAIVLRGPRAGRTRCSTARTTGCWSSSARAASTTSRRRCEYARRLAGRPSAAGDELLRGDARVLREAAHHDRLEGADQRPAPRRLRATSTPGCGSRGSCCSTSWRSASRSAASSWIRSSRSTSPTPSAGGRSAPGRPRARSIASSARGCRCRSASRTAPTAGCRPAVDAVRAAAVPARVRRHRRGRPLGDRPHARQPRLPRDPPRRPRRRRTSTPADVERALALLRAAGLPERLMIDLSHDNSGKQPERQPAVAADVAAQLASGQPAIVGAMLESFLVGGRQELWSAGRRCVYGQSITDGCLGWEETEAVLDLLSEAVVERRGARPHADRECAAADRASSASGLIGGSVAIAARERLGAEVTGFDADPGVRDAGARRRGARPGPGRPSPRRWASAEAVFAAVPVGALAGTVGEILAAAPADCVVTDVGSTKRAIVAAIADPRFVGGHPLAGAETSGVRARPRGSVRRRATWYLTPGAETSGVLYERLHRLLTGLGARPCAVDASAPRPHPGHRLAPAARVRQPARRPGLAARPRRAASCSRPPARAFATRPEWRARRARCGPTSTSSTPRRSSTRSTGRSPD